MKNLKLSGLMAALVVLAVSGFTTGCGGSSAAKAESGGGGKIITANPANNDVSKEEFLATAPGTKLKVWLNRSGRTVQEFECMVVGGGTAGSTSEMLVELPVQVGLGDSGSPVFTEDGRYDAVLFAGSGDAKKAFVKYAGDVREVFNYSRGVDGGPTTRQGVTLFTTGLTQAGINKFASHSGLKVVALSGTDQGATTETRGGYAPLVGETACVMAVSGDVVDMYAYGVLSMHEGGSSVAFGHPFFYMGTSQWPVRAASTAGVMSDGIGYFKVAYPIGGTAGTLTQDRGNGCLIEWGEMPQTIKVQVNVSSVGRAAKTYNHEATHDIDEGYYVGVATYGSVLDYEDSYSKGVAMIHLVFRYQDGSERHFDQEIDATSQYADLPNSIASYVAYEAMSEARTYGTIAEVNLSLTIRR